MWTVTEGELALYLFSLMVFITFLIASGKVTQAYRDRKFIKRWEQRFGRLDDRDDYDDKTN